MANSNYFCIVTKYIKRALRYRSLRNSTTTRSRFYNFLKHYNKYSYYKFANAEFGISILVYLLYHLEASLYLCYSAVSIPLTLIQSGQTHPQTHTIEF